MAVPHAPKDLRAAGKRLWSSVQRDLDLDEHEIALLRAACRIADRCEAIAEEMVGESQTVTNRHGDLVSHPLIVESRMQAAALAKTLASLRLPTGLASDGEMVRPQRRGAARAARAARAAYGIRGAV